MIFYPLHMRLAPYLFVPASLLSLRSILEASKAFAAEATFLALSTMILDPQ
jgi:hypothetical protein